VDSGTWCNGRSSRSLLCRVSQLRSVQYLSTLSLNTFRSTRAEEPIAHVPKMTRVEISLARGISLLSQFCISFARSASVYCEEYVHTYRHILNCVETVCALLLLPKDTESETCLQKLGAVRCVDRICTAPLGCRPGGDWANA